MLPRTNFEMSDRRRRPKVVPRAAADFVQQLKIETFHSKKNWNGNAIFKLARQKSDFQRKI